jgi:undecaprenyl-diphosphatase
MQLPWLRLRRLEQHELNWLLVGIAACLLLLVFLALAGEVAEGDTQAFDVKVVKALRSPVDPSRPIGPAWLEVSLVDVSALGGPTVLGLMLAAVVGFLLLQTRYRTALFVTMTTAGGELVSYILKQTFNRPRPSVIPNLRIMSPSFPSGHAMESAIVYLTLGAVLMRVAERRLTKLYCLGIATLLTTLIGISRVYLGVHYPTDVVAGWIVGFGWASMCWLIAQQFEARTGIAAERDKAE